MKINSTTNPAIVFLQAISRSKLSRAFPDFPLISAKIRLSFLQDKLNDKKCFIYKEFVLSFFRFLSESINNLQTFCVFMENKRKKTCEELWKLVNKCRKNDRFLFPNTNILQKHLT